MLIAIVLVDDMECASLSWKLQELATKERLRYKHMRTLRQLKTFLNRLDDNEEILLVSDTKLGSFCSVIMDFLVCEPRENLEKSIKGFLIYSADTEKGGCKMIPDETIAGLSDLSIGCFHPDEEERIIDRVHEYLELWES